MREIGRDFADIRHADGDAPLDEHDRALWQPREGDAHAVHIRAPPPLDVPAAPLGLNVGARVLHHPHAELGVMGPLPRSRL